MTKPIKWPVHPAKTQISLGICPVWSESSLSAWKHLGSLPILRAHSKDSDQTRWMSRLICVFAGCTCPFVGFVMLWLKCIPSVKGAIGDRNQSPLCLIRTFHGYLVWIEKSAQRVTVWHIKRGLSTDADQWSGGTDFSTHIKQITDPFLHILQVFIAFDHI